MLKELEDWLHNLPGTSVDILRLAELVGPSVIRALLCREIRAGRPATASTWCIPRMIAAIELLLQAPKAGASIIYVRLSIPRAASFIRRWPASWASRPRIL